MKLIDFYNAYVNSHNEIIPPQIKNAHDYLENSENAIYQFILRHESVSINTMSTSEWTMVLQSVIASNSYKYDKLWETTQLEYDPLYNYDKTSTITTQHGQSVVTDVIGDRVSTNKVGDRISTNKVGDRISTNKVGEVSTTFKNGESTNTTVNSETAIDTTSFKEVDKIETINGSVTNSTTTPTHTDVQSVDGYTDVQTVDGYTDVQSVDGYTDVQSVDGYIDTHTTSKNNDIVTEVTKGNIGVVSSIDLLQQQRELVQFSFINIFMTDVLAVISNGYFE